MPAGVTSLRVLCVGGGASGAGLSFGGGGSGNVSSGTIAVTPGNVHTITVGAGAPAGPGGTCTANGAAGNSSSFGSLLSCSGGAAGPVNYQGGDGGSGGGAACYFTCTAGSGGTNGAAGQSITGPNSGLIIGGTGQGSFTPHFVNFTQNTFSAGAGGAGVYNPKDAGGSGGGGVLMNGTGPSGQQGANVLYSGMGGRGYGAGGGSGGCDTGDCASSDAGGNAAPGLVYIEWNPIRKQFLYSIANRTVRSLRSFSITI